MGSKKKCVGRNRKRGTDKMKHLAKLKSNPGIVAVEITKRPNEISEVNLSKIMNSLPNSFLSLSIVHSQVRMILGAAMFASSNTFLKQVKEEKLSIITKGLDIQNISYKIVKFDDEHDYFEKNFNNSKNISISCLKGIPQKKKEDNPIDKFIDASLETKSNIQLILIYRAVSPALLNNFSKRISTDTAFLEKMSEYAPSLQYNFRQIKEIDERMEVAKKTGFGQFQSYIITASDETNSDNRSLSELSTQIFSNNNTLRSLSIKLDDVIDTLTNPIIQNLVYTDYINGEELNTFGIPTRVEVNDNYPALPLPSKETATKKDGFSIGTILDRDKPVWDLMLDETDFHLLIEGPTGTGKSTLLNNIGGFVMKNPKKRFWAIDPERSYRDNIIQNGGLIFMLRDLRTIFKASLTQPPPGMNKYIWSNIWISMLCRAENGGDGAQLMIFNAVRAAYIIGKRHGFEISLLHVYIILVEFSASIEGSKIGYRLKDYLVTANRMVAALLCLTPDGSTDPIFDNPRGFDFKELLNRHIAWETGNLGDTEKRALIGYLLQTLYSYKRQIEEEDDMEIYLAIDEAHTLFYEAMNGEETEIDKILRQILKYKVRVILANQGLNKLSDNAIINSRTKICFNTSEEDKLNKVMGITDIKGLKTDRLKSYHAIVKMSQRFVSPVIIETKDRPSKRISDRDVAEYMKPFYTDKKEMLDDKQDFTIHVSEAVNLMHKDPVIEKYLSYELSDKEVTKEDLIHSMSEDEKKVIKRYESIIKGRFSAKEQRLKKQEEEMQQMKNILFDKMVLSDEKILFLKTIIQNPFLPVNSLYEKCGLNKTDGNKIRKELELKDFLISSKTVHPIGEPRVGITLFDIPYDPNEERSLKVFKKHNIEYKQNPREGGIIHRYYVNEVLRVSQEVPNIISHKEYLLDIPGENKWVDVVNEKVDSSGNVLEKTAIEIETCADGYESAAKNIEKALKAGIFDNIWILTVDKDHVLPIVAFLREKGILPDPDNKIRVMHIQRLFEKRRSNNP